MKSLSSKTYQCGVTIQGLTTLSGTVYLTGITNTASWDHVIVGTTAQGQIYTRTYAQFMGDVATGISLSSYVTGSGTTNYLSKFTGGSALGNSQIFDNGTNVGIGISSPTEKLHIVSSAAGNQFGRITATDSNASAAWVAQNDSGDNVVYRVFSSGVSGTQMGSALGRSASLLANLGGSGVFLLGTFSNTNFVLGTNNTENMRITTAGNVGIGTTSPGAKLDVNGAQIIQSAAGFGTDADQAALFLSNTANFGLSGNFSGYSRNLIKSDGGSILTVGRWNTSLIGELSIESGSSGLIKFLAGASERMRITSAGNVGIGTTNPGYTLEVNGIIKSGIAGNSSANYAALVVASAGTTTSQAAIAIQQLTSEGDTIIFGDYEPYVEYNFMHENASNVFHIHSGEITNSLGSNTFYNRSGNSRTGYIKWSLYQGNGDMHVGGSVGIGNTSPSTKLDVSGVITATGGNSTNWNTAYGWGNHASASYVPQARTLTINGTSYDLSANRSWTISASTPGGSDTQVQYNSSGSLAGASALTYNSTTNRVGINQASPGYDLDVNGQVRVQDKLRVGTGNGVVHMSSTATINASATTVVWAQTVSVGMCAFIEYYILNSTSLTDQRAGTIIVTWNQSGTPTITHTETTTPDIGSTTTVNFTSSLVGSDARINAVNSSANPYTMVMSYKYF